MKGRCRRMVAGAGFVMTLSCVAAGASDTLVIGDTTESTTGGFKFPDGTIQTTAATGGSSGINLNSPDGSITVGGTTTAPTVEINFTQLDALYAPASGSANYAPASGSANYVATTGDSMTGGLAVATSGSHALHATTSGSSSGHGVYSYSTGLGRAGVFEINNPSNGGEAVLAKTTGSGQAVAGYTSGSGNAGLFYIDNAANSADSLYAFTSGLGRAGYFQVSNAANGSPALYGTTNGNGEAVRGYATGAGGAGTFEIANASSNARAVTGITNGKGAAGYFTTSGTGDAVYGSTNNSGSAVAGWNSGTTGKAGHFEIKNVVNGSDVIYATTNGVGNAGNFNGKVNVSGILTTAGFKLTGGTPGTGKVLTSDAGGTASWQASAGDSTKVAKAGDTMSGPLNISVGTTTNHALHVTTNDPSGAGHGIYSYSTGLSRAGVFEIRNGSNGGEAILAKTNGSGSAVYGDTTGTGNAGAFSVNNPASNGDALYATTNGSGYAGNFNGKVNVSGNLTVSGTGAMPVYSASGGAQAAPHMVTGTAAVSGVGNVSLSGAAAFSSAGSYSCTATMQTASPTVFPVGVEYVSGNSFNLYCSAAATVSYICVGN